VHLAKFLCALGNFFGVLGYFFLVYLAAFFGYTWLLFFASENLTEWTSEARVGRNFAPKKMLHRRFLGVTSSIF
jgi:hypothetical protein